jgi:TonB family protein
MFDTYLVAHAVDPRARRRLTAAAIAALAASAFVIGSAATANKLTISRVNAPRIDHVLVMPIDVPPPPGAAPPPAPKAASAASDDDATPDDESRDDDDDLAPLDAPVRAAAGRGDTTGAGGPDGPSSPIPGTGTCLVPGCIAGPAAPKARVQPPGDPPPVTHAPIDAVREHAIFSPDPPRSELARTPAALARRDAPVTVGFCVDTSGRVDDVRVKIGSGDPEVDRICKKTVERWRFRAMVVDGAPRRTCTKVTFEIAFE